MRQRQKVLNYMYEHPEGMTQLDAIREYGITRLGAVIFEIKKRGVPVDTEYQKVTNRDGDVVSIARYRYAPKTVEERV